MIRGDTNNLVFKIKKKGTEEYIDGSIYTEIEVQFNTQNDVYALKKLKSKNEVMWEDDHFIVFLSQEDTFKLNDGCVSLQVRLFTNGSCKATIVKRINVGKVLSEEVLS